MNVEEVFILSYLANTKRLLEVAKSVSRSRYSLMYPAKILKKYINSRFTECIFPVGDFVSYLDTYFPTTDEKEYAGDVEWIRVDFTNGSEFSSHTFPITYINLSKDEIFIAENKLVSRMKVVSDRRTEADKIASELAYKERELEALKKKETADFEEYLRLRKKYEPTKQSGVNYG